MTDNIKLNASGHQILQSDFIKILGIFYTKTFDNTRNINSIISQVNYRLNYCMVGGHNILIILGM